MIKRFFISFLCLTLFYSLIISFAASADNPKTVRVGLYDNAPKIFTDTNGNASGFWPDIMGYIASQEGWKIQYVHGTWSECLQRLENNEIDIMPDVAYNDARGEIYAFPNEVAYTSWSTLYTRAGTKIQSVLDLGGKTIAVMKGSVNVEGQGGIKQLVSSFNLNCTFKEVDSYTNVFNAVKRGEADAGVTSKDFGYQHEAEYNLIDTPIIFQPANLYFAFTKNASLTPYLIERTDYHLKILKENPNSIYYQSLRKWFAEAPVQTIHEYVLPGWAISAIAAFGWCVLVFGVGIVVLRSQVRSRTKALREDIAKRKQAEEETIKSEAKYAALVEQSNDGIIIIQDGRVVFINRKMIDLTAYSTEEIIGKSFVDFLTPKYQQSVADRNRRRMLGESVPVRYEAELAARNGKAVSVDVNTSVIEYEGKPATMAIIRDTTEQNKIWAALLDRDTRLSIIYNNISDVIFVMDVETGGDFRFKSVNRRFMEITGFQEDQVTDKLVREIITEPSLSIVMGKYKEAINTRRPVYWEEVSEYPAGTRYGEVTVVPVTDANGDYTRLIGTVHDITERKHTDAELAKYREHLEKLVDERTNELTQRNDELAHANIRLQEMDRMKSIFLASMSHELRTPLNSIIGFTGNLLMGLPGPLNDEQKKQLTFVKSSSELLLGLINDILDISKIEAGKVELNPEEFRLMDVVKEVMEPLLQAAGKKGVALTAEVSEGVSIFCDKRRFKQILLNLLSNAVKFTERGSVKVLADVSSDNRLAVRVIDTGIGIRKEEMGRLFQPFQQVGTSLAKKYEGTGLGLYLTDKLVTLLGGNISVQSEYGQGSEFTFVLPLRRTEGK